jgi:hypothetical protein
MKLKEQIIMLRMKGHSYEIKNELGCKAIIYIPQRYR